ncbi:50S ribosomal protein L9 [Lentimicrobium sp.]|jgi:large subunit ribosomal protein L9|uniref:50S ribosomal protein L9 n=1 Tax=Lentimicrobium sp. TaxID=2034841 RepID=UPI0025F69A52|nr:50S ribosomal protein L9 [Lentimicrobium sp.]MCO5257222.1 50S ribosomal protein L9 [Lentimicrobium sp.]MCO5262615.1 50S ribosomal protein L9 [Lentimicrobium sp.]HPF64913.1 50S ribosomal protein L9 [Lentimicrobium sp.]HPJ61533.1 50S ribosomal protein L9 [Lentimicrobium sp.]HPR26229.1 50S ribosomal protein L9 [Lentimicrobium sp.]
MEVILKKDIPNLGYATDIVKVRDGYGRNYLIPQGFAMLATEANKKMNAETLKQKAFKEEKVRKEAEAMVKLLENVKVKIGAKVASTGKIFGSVNALQIAEALKEQFNYDIDRKKIHLDGDSVKEVGEYKAKVMLHKGVSVMVNFEVFAE